MSFLERMEKKKNKYLQAARSIAQGSKARKNDEDKDKEKEKPEEEDPEGSDDGPEEVAIAGDKSPDTANRAPKSSQSVGTPSKDKSDKKDEKEQKGEKEIWKYEGETNNDGEYHGVGRLYSTTTIEFYEGQWVNGKREGFGTQLFVTGERYQGAWKGGLMDGMGVISYPSKDSFTGVWELGQRVTGTWNFTNADTNVVFTEKWVNGAPGAFGELVFNPGGKYIGEVSYAIVGKFTIKNYSVFRHGYGEMIYSNKNKYIGGWKKDARKGFGIFIENTGEKYYGEWTRGKRSGYGVQIYTDGTYYEGQHLHDEMKGKGKICVPNGDTIMGEWANNKLTSATFLKGNFDLVPRPMREVFVSNVQTIRKAEEKAPFISVEKWQAYVAELEIGPQTWNLDQVESTLLQIATEMDSEVRDYTYVIPANSVNKAVNRFIYLFNWQYSAENLADQTKASTTYVLQTAVDDVNSFLASMTLKIVNSLHLDYHGNKRVFELLMQTVFHKIYKTLFPLYIDHFRVKDAVLSAKLSELKDTTTVSIGVKPRYQLVKEVPKPSPAPPPAAPLPSSSSSPTLPPSVPADVSATSPMSASASLDETPKLGSPLGYGARGSTGSRRRPKIAASQSEQSEESEQDGKDEGKDSKEAEKIDPATGLPKAAAPSRTHSTRDRERTTARFNTLTGQARRQASVGGSESRHGKRDKSKRHSMNVAEAARPVETKMESIDDLVDQLAKDQLEKRDIINEVEEEKSPRPPAAVSPGQATDSPKEEPKIAEDANLPEKSNQDTAPIPLDKSGESRSATTESEKLLESDEPREQKDPESLQPSSVSSDAAMASIDSSEPRKAEESKTEVAEPKKDDIVESKPVDKNLEANQEQTPAKQSPRGKAIDPNDINAQLALEASSRRTRGQSMSAKELEIEFMKKMGSLIRKNSNSALGSSPSVVVSPNSSASSPAPPKPAPLLKAATMPFPGHHREKSSDSHSESLTESSTKTVEPVDISDPRMDLPFFAVMKAIDRLDKATSPIDKLECLNSAGQAILKCVDDWHTDKSQQIVMGAEDKFPILIYALIRSKAKYLRCHAQFLSDFITEHVGDMDSKYRVSELHDALKYIESLQWNVRDKSGYMIPVKLILSNVAWAAKGLRMLKVPDGMVKTQVQADIVVCLSQIFRALGDRVHTPYEPFEVPSQFSQLIKTFKSTVFDGAFGKEVGLSLKEKATGDGFILEFGLRHPLYVYSQLAQAAIAPDSVETS